jgi:UDP-N-acetyl-D-mannosaminuronate dehydrogenase
VNLWEIVDAIRVRKTHSNLMFPNIGVGGYCLTKDPLLASWARKNFFDQSEDLFMSVDSVSINDQMPMFAYKRLRSVFGDLKDKRIAFFGVSYRGDVGDTRFTPVRGLYELVSLDSKETIIHDPFVDFWEELDLQVFDSAERIFKFNPEILIFSTAHSIYKQENFVDKILNLKPLSIFDSVGLFDECQIQNLSTRHRISIIGRGDIS